MPSTLTIRANLTLSDEATDRHIRSALLRQETIEAAIRTALLGAIEPPTLQGMTSSITSCLYEQEPEPEPEPEPDPIFTFETYYTAEDLAGCGAAAGAEDFNDYFADLVKYEIAEAINRSWPEMEAFNHDWDDVEVIREAFQFQFIEGYVRISGQLRIPHPNN